MSEHAYDHNDHEHATETEDAETRYVTDVLLARGLRLMGVYELLGIAFDSMTEEIRAQEAIRVRCNEPDYMLNVTVDAVRMAQTIAGVRDKAAGVVAAIFGEQAFKTGEIQKAYHKHLIEHAKQHGIQFPTDHAEDR